MAKLGRSRARRLAERAGAEIASARSEDAMTVPAVARRAGVSADTVRRIEAGDPAVGLANVCAVAEAVGLEPVVSVYPGRRPGLRDTGQMTIARHLIEARHPSLEARLEATAGERGEAGDLLLLGPSEIIHVEIDRRIDDFQDRYRRNAAKRNWLAAHHDRPVRLVMVVEDTPRNRTALAGHREVTSHVLPASSRDVLRALATGRPLGRDGLLWIRRRDPPRRYIARK